jgi:hypothetical protein
VIENIFFHVGLHKTATTWFQRHLFPNLAGVTCHVTKRVQRIDRSRGGSPTLVISHESLSGSLSSEKRPGDNRKRLAETVALIAAKTPGAAVIIGFREHISWLTAAYAHKAKKDAVNFERYARTFSGDDLSWCSSLALVEGACSSVFPFLYEELFCAPEALIDDLCRFLNVKAPQNLQELLRNRENPSPRSQAGQLVSRSFFQTSYALDRFAGVNTRSLREFGARIGAQLDRNFAPRRVVLDHDITCDLRRDWECLLPRIGDHRGRDFSVLLAHGQVAG